MIIDSIRTFIISCPYLQEGAMGVDFLGEDPISYSIQSVPVQPIIKKYVNGDCEKQYVFTLSSRESYGADVIQNMENSGFYERFAEWLDEQTLEGNLPELKGNKSSIKIEALTTGYAFQTSEDTAQYQIQCRLVYFKGGN